MSKKKKNREKLRTLRQTRPDSSGRVQRVDLRGCARQIVGIACVWARGKHCLVFIAAWPRLGEFPWTGRIRFSVRAAASEKHELETKVKVEPREPPQLPSFCSFEAAGGFQENRKAHVTAGFFFFFIIYRKTGGRFEK